MTFNWKRGVAETGIMALVVGAVGGLIYGTVQALMYLTERFDVNVALWSFFGTIVALVLVGTFVVGSIDG